MLKFGPNSTRYKDIFDMCYLSEYVNIPRLRDCLRELIFSDPGMRENNMEDVRRRITRTFESETYVKNLAASRHNWLAEEPRKALSVLQSFLQKL